MRTLVYQTQSVRPLAQVGTLCAALLYSATAGIAPHVGYAGVVEVRELGPVAPDPAVDPPSYADIGDIRLPRVRARAAMVYNPRTHEVLWESNGREQRPIASISKVMTALVFLEDNPDLSRDVVVSRRDVRRASTTYLRRGERVRMEDVLHLALIASDNAAARVLARVSPWGTEGFVIQMNRKARELGLDDTRFADPSGLSQLNVSTAFDVSRLIAHASQHPGMVAITQKSAYRLRTDRRRLRIRNTNRLLRGSLDVVTGKTGYIDASGYCLATLIDLPDGDPLTVVVLGVGTNSGRFREVRRLVDWLSTDGRPLVASDGPDAIQAN